MKCLDALRVGYHYSVIQTFKHNCEIVIIEQVKSDVTHDCQSRLTSNISSRSVSLISSFSCDTEAESLCSGFMRHDDLSTGTFT